MKKHIALLSIALIPAFACAGEPEIVQMSPNTYMIAKQSKAGIFGNSAKMKANIIRQANEFAASQGKIAIPLASSEVPMAIGQFASFEYQFRLIDKYDPEAQKTYLAPRSNLAIEVNGTQPSAPTQGPTSDLYAELLKLDDLRKRGIITQAEFESEKRKLLSAP